jgi:DNA-binding MarR family transcriptional regulator
MNKPLPRNIDYKSLADFRYEIRRFLNFSESAARAAGIEPQQHQALLAIKGRAPGFETTVGALAERLQVRHHTAVELSNRLEANGWIHRSRSPEDGRRVELRLTRRGEQLLEKLSVSHRNELRTAGPRLIAALQSVIANRGAQRARHNSAGRASPSRSAASVRRGSR